MDDAPLMTEDSSDAVGPPSEDAPVIPDRRVVPGRTFNGAAGGAAAMITALALWGAVQGSLAEAWVITCVATYAVLMAIWGAKGIVWFLDHHPMWTYAVASTAAAVIVGWSVADVALNGPYVWARDVSSMAPTVAVVLVVVPVALVAVMLERNRAGRSVESPSWEVAPLSLGAAIALLAVAA